MAKHVTKIITVYSDGSIETSTPKGGIKALEESPDPPGQDTPKDPPPHP